MKGEELPGKQVSVTGLSDPVGRTGTGLLSPPDTLRLPTSGFRLLTQTQAGDDGVAAIDKTSPRNMINWPQRYL